MYAYICHMCVDVYGGLKRLWDFWELKLQVVRSCPMWGLRTELRFSEWEASILNCWVIWNKLFQKKKKSSWVHWIEVDCDLGCTNQGQRETDCTSCGVEGEVWPYISNQKFPKVSRTSSTPPLHNDNARMADCREAGTKDCKPVNRDTYLHTCEHIPVNRDTSNQVSLWARGWNVTHQACGTDSLSAWLSQSRESHQGKTPSFLH